MNLLVLIIAQLFLFLMRYKSTRHIENSSEINEKQYETEFLWLNHRLIEQHQANTLKYLPLRIENRDSNNLANLCMQHPGLRVIPLNQIFPIKVKHYGPKIQFQLMGFRRLEPKRRPQRPVLVELIRCTEISAVTTASRGNHYSYFLINDSKDSEPIFYIAGKFKYKEQVPNAAPYPTTQKQFSWENRTASERKLGFATFSNDIVHELNI